MATTHPKWEDEDMLTPGEVAKLFRVDPKTATRWGRAGRIPDLDDEPLSVIRTPGGHMRFRYKTVRLILEGKLKMKYADGPVSMPAVVAVRP